jgi:hypothetical protein
MPASKVTRSFFGSGVGSHCDDFCGKKGVGANQIPGFDTMVGSMYRVSRPFELLGQDSLIDNAVFHQEKA